MATDQFSVIGVVPDLAAITILGSGRLGPTVSALLGLLGTVLGGLALARASGRTVATSRSSTAVARRGPTAALALGIVSLSLGVLFLATADGGPGTGNGVVGSAVAIVAGVAAMALGGLATARRRGHTPATDR